MGLRARGYVVWVKEGWRLRSRLQAPRGFTLGGAMQPVTGTVPHQQAVLNGVVSFQAMKCVGGLPIFAFTSILIFGFSNSLPLLIFTL